MSVTCTRTISSGGIQFSAAKALTPSDETIVTGTFAVSNGSTDALWNLGGIDVSQVVACYLSSTKAVTLETNATDASGGNTITLAADVPYMWNTGSPDTLKLTADVTKIYVSNASGSAATVSALIVQDGSP